MIKDEIKECVQCRRQLSLNYFRKYTYLCKNENKNIHIFYSNKCKSCTIKDEGYEFSIYDDITESDIIKYYEEVLKGKRKSYPSVVHKKYPDYQNILLKYLYREKLKCDTKEKVCEMFNGNTMRKYKLNSTYLTGKTLMELLEITYPEYKIFPWELVYGNIHGMYDTEKNRKDCIEWFINKLELDKVINNIEDIFKLKNLYKLFAKYSISNILKHYNNSHIEALMWYFNDHTDKKIYEWSFRYLPRNFWNKENSKRAYLYMLSEMGFDYQWCDDVKKEFIINNITKRSFVDFHVSGTYKYFGNIYEATKQTFNKELFYQWELKYTPSGFWLNEENRLIALKQLIEDVLKINVKEIPLYMTHSYLKDTPYNKFCTICLLYYENFYSWVNQVYPNKFIEEDFVVYKSSDGTIFSSHEELRVYEHIKNNLCNKIKYIGKSRHKKYNYDIGESRCFPDFVIEKFLDKPIIIEYFGFYQKKSQMKRFKKYAEKTHVKIDFFNNNKDVYFIPLFKEDLYCEYKGINDKFAKILNRKGVSQIYVK